MTDGLRTDDLIPRCYALLKLVARRERSRWHPPPDSQTTEIVHSAFLRIARHAQTWASREDFIAAAANTMRQVRVDEARRRLAAKRGGGVAALPLEAAEHLASREDREDADLLALDAALAFLEREHPRLAKLIELRFFAGMTHDETAAALGVNEKTLRRDWIKARAWLAEQDGLRRD